MWVVTVLLLLVPAASLYGSLTNPAPTPAPMDRAMGWHRVEYLWAYLVWDVALAVVGLALFSGRRWAWSAVVPPFLALTATVLAQFALCLSLLPKLSSQGTPADTLALAREAADLLPFYPFGAAIFIALAVCLFRAHPWFGVPRRRAWITTFREGWWSWAVTFLLDVLYPLVSYLRY